MYVYIYTFIKIISACTCLIHRMLNGQQLLTVVDI